MPRCHRGTWLSLEHPGHTLWMCHGATEGPVRAKPTSGLPSCPQPLLAAVLSPLLGLCPTGQGAAVTPPASHWPGRGSSVGTCCSRQTQKYSAAGRDPGGTATQPPCHSTGTPKATRQGSWWRGAPHFQGTASTIVGPPGERGQKDIGDRAAPIPGCLAGLAVGQPVPTPRTASPCPLPGYVPSWDTCLSRGWTASDTGARSLGRASLTSRAGTGTGTGESGPKIALQQRRERGHLRAGPALRWHPAGTGLGTGRG